MTKEETAQLIRMNFTLYKLGSKPLTDEEMETTIDVWTYQFRDYPGEVVMRAFLAANRVCVYPITVADIYKQFSQCIDPEAEWGALADAARKAQKYMSWKNFPMVTGIDEKGGLIRSDGTEELQALYDSLPPAAKTYAGNVGGLKELAMTPDLTYRRVEFLKQSREDITTTPREAARLRGTSVEEYRKTNPIGAGRNLRVDRAKPSGNNFLDIPLQKNLRRLKKKGEESA